MNAEKIDKKNTIPSRLYWGGVGSKIWEGIRMHQLTGQLEKGPQSWRNVTEHCLVQVARSEVLGTWIGLPDELIVDMRMGAVLHDFNKKQEITATREANQTGASPLVAVRAEGNRADNQLRKAGFADRVIKLSNASGGDAPVLTEVQRILDQEILSDEEWAYLIIHYVDDCSIGTNWVVRSQEGRNIIDYRMEGNRQKPDYTKIANEIERELSNHPKLGTMNIYDAACSVSHQIEQRLANRLKEKTGEEVDSLAIPELIDEKIREAIASFK